MKYADLFLLWALILSVASPVQADPWADNVVTVNYGAGAGFGQEYYPGNILGPPDTAATAIVPSNSPQELLELGFGGMIILEFSDNVIVDLPGSDFTVFENPFWIGGNPEMPFVEAGIVAISADGINWREFPYDPETYEGLAGVTPTNGSEDPTDPEVSGGDSFDLFELGLDTVRFVRITDAGDLVPDNGWTSFDLDAVVAVHSEELTSTPRWNEVTPESYALSAFPNPFNLQTTISLTLEKREYVMIELYDAAGKLRGRLLKNGMQAPVSAGLLAQGVHYFSLSAHDLPSGCYFLQASLGKNHTIVQKITVLK